jgi:hypothetical protein
MVEARFLRAPGGIGRTATRDRNDESVRRRGHPAQCRAQVEAVLVGQLNRGEDGVGAEQWRRGEGFRPVATVLTSCPMLRNRAANSSRVSSERSARRTRKGCSPHVLGSISLPLVNVELQYGQRGRENARHLYCRQGIKPATVTSQDVKHLHCDLVTHCMCCRMAPWSKKP